MVTRESAIPLYQQIKHHVLHEISSGRIAVHGRLPSERDLMKQWNVSRITVRQALNDLVLQGHLYAVPGKGFFVSDRQEQPQELNAFLSFSVAAVARKQIPRSQILTAQIIPASPSLAQQLHLEPDAEVFELIRIRYLDDVPVGVQSIWLPHTLCEGILAHDFSHVSLYNILREQYCWILAQARMTISARPASFQEITWLEMSEPGVVLTVDQVTYNAEQQPVELSFSRFHPQRYPLSIIHTNQGATAPGV